MIINSVGYKLWYKDGAACCYYPSIKTTFKRTIATSLLQLIFIDLPSMKPANTLFILFLIAVSLKGKAQQADALQNFAARLQYDVAHDSVGSISALVFSGGKIIFARAYGLAEREKSIPADTATIYRAASITKTLTAAMMMVLVQRGQLNPDDPVEKYLPEIKRVKKYWRKTPITFAQLAAHTSGLEKEPRAKGYDEGPFDEWENKLIGLISKTKASSAPGERFRYSNIGYGILGLALSRVTGKPYTQLAKELVFDPVGMHSSFFVTDSASKSRLASGYICDPFEGTVDGQLPQAEHKGRGYKVPNGGLYTTPADLARLLMALCPGSQSPLLDEKHRNMMQTIQTPESREYGYGLGFNIPKTGNGIKIVEHDGGVPGYQCNMVMNPETCTGVIIMRNYDFGLTSIVAYPRAVLLDLLKENRQ